jgi:hypothetical protein
MSHHSKWFLEIPRSKDSKGFFITPRLGFSDDARDFTFKVRTYLTHYNTTIARGYYTVVHA